MDKKTWKKIEPFINEIGIATQKLIATGYIPKVHVHFTGTQAVVSVDVEPLELTK